MRQFSACCAALLIAACASDRAEEGVAPPGPVYGGVVADEPRAAEAGREVLTAGGSAADAATAMYFAMAVTLPSRASLGGGGLCLVFDPKERNAQSIEFLARAPAHAAAGGDRPTAVPGNVRGFSSLQARYGRLRWSQVLVGAENLARFGMPVSRAFADDLKQVSAALMAQPAAQQVFAASEGGLVAEGDRLVQNDLASVLARIRIEGPGDFYAGMTARRLSEGAAAAGGPLDLRDLQAYEPVWRPAITVEGGGLTAHFPPPPPPAGTVAAEMWAMLVGRDRYEDADEVERAHLLADATARALADRQRWEARLGAGELDAQSLVSRGATTTLMTGYDPERRTPAAELGLPAQPTPENPAAASFIAVDVTGLAVACQVTPNNMFGTGRVAPGTGIVLASVPGPGGRGATALGPMLVSDGPQFLFAAAASGGQTAPTTTVATAARTLLAEVDLPSAGAARRMHRSTAPDFVFVEQGADADVVRGLSRMGYELGYTPTIGRVVAAHCPDGSPDDPATCVYAADPRGYGLAAQAEGAGTRP
ncbi:MAG TPA: gamma-glutamyltransferase [Rhodospirillales bacterium]|nr:gamma-glutamyltransferase [Rhodospirillales bacterium]